MLSILRFKLNQRLQGEINEYEKLVSSNLSDFAQVEASLATTLATFDQTMSTALSQQKFDADSFQILLRSQYQAQREHFQCGAAVPMGESRLDGLREVSVSRQSFCHSKARNLQFSRVDSYPSFDQISIDIPEPRLYSVTWAGSEHSPSASHEAQTQIYCQSGATATGTAILPGLGTLVAWLVSVPACYAAAKITTAIRTKNANDEIRERHQRERAREAARQKREIEETANWVSTNPISSAIIANHAIDHCLNGPSWSHTVGKISGVLDQKIVSFEAQILNAKNRLATFDTAVKDLESRIRIFERKWAQADAVKLEEGLIKKIRVNQKVTEFAFDYREFVQPLRVKIVACTQVFGKPIEDQIQCVDEAIDSVTNHFGRIFRKWVIDDNKNHPFIKRKEQEFLNDLAYCQQYLEQLRAEHTY